MSSNWIEDAEDLAVKLMELRLEAGVTQTELAKRVGLTKWTIGRMEKARYYGWKYSQIWRFADALGYKIKISFEKR